MAAAAALLLLLAGCSDPQGTGPEAAATAEDEPSAAGTPGDAGGDVETPDASEGSVESGSGGPDDGGGDSSGDGNGGRDGPGASGSGSDGGPGDSSDYPAAGGYVFAQRGFERFCRGPSCDRDPLPKTATVSASYEQQSPDEAVVVAEARSSEQQTLTTTTRYTPDKALITKVVIDFAYQGFNFSQTYEPQPPVESLLLPLGAQSGWRGRWKARTSGDYRVKVQGREDVTVGGSTVSAYRLETVTNFKGDFSGRAQITAWVDPATKMVIKTDGQIAVASNFGTYTSDFRTTLRSGPGY